VTTLEDLARVLGGTIKVWHDQRWLDTTIGDLRAAIIEQRRPLTLSTIFDLAVLTPSALDFEPVDTHPLDGWHLEGDAMVLPHLEYGYVFAGCRAGILFATTSSAPNLEQIIATLWSLAALARHRWTPASEDDGTTDQERARRWRRAGRLVRRVLFVVAVVLLVNAVRSCP